MKSLEWERSETLENIPSRSHRIAIFVPPDTLILKDVILEPDKLFNIEYVIIGNIIQSRWNKHVTVCLPSMAIQIYVYNEANENQSVKVTVKGILYVENDVLDPNTYLTTCKD